MAGGEGDAEDYVTCRLLLRLCINAALATPDTPLSRLLERQAALLSSQLLPSCLSLARLFVQPVSDQPDADDRSLLLDLLDLFAALHPSFVTAAQAPLVTLVMDIAKRRDARLQSRALQLLGSWAPCHAERVLPFLSSRLLSSFPSLQSTALLVLARLAAQEEGTEAVEAALKALPRVAALLSSPHGEVATRALELLRGVVRHQEAREEVWTAEGLRAGLWKAMREGRGAQVMALLATLALSVSLHATMRAHGVVARAVEWMERSGEEEAGLRSAWRLLQRLLDVWVEWDGADDEARSDRQWEWKALQALQPGAVSPALVATHRSVAAELLRSTAFVALLLAAPTSRSPSPVLLERARVGAALLATAVEANDGADLPPPLSQATSEAGAAVVEFLSALSQSPRFADQHAAARAWRQLLSERGGSGWAREPLRSRLLPLLRSDSALVVSECVGWLPRLQWREAELEAVRGAGRRWAAEAAGLQGREEEELMDSEAFVLRLHQRLQEAVTAIASTTSTIQSPSGRGEAGDTAVGAGEED